MKEKEDELKAYIYYARNSQDKETVYSVLAHTLKEATKSFADMKSLSVKDFLKIYCVKLK